MNIKAYVIGCLFIIFSSLTHAEIAESELEQLVQELRSALGDDVAVESGVNAETATKVSGLAGTSQVTLEEKSEEKSEDKADAIIINVGDRLKIFLPGGDELNSEFAVDDSGFIELPEVGDIPVSGLTLNQAIISVRQALSRVYRDVSRLELTIKQHRLLVTVLGFVEKPGQINLGKNANIQMALSLAGGLKAGAQLDKMQLKRNGESITFNYKAYLDSGDELLIPTLQTMDSLFVPASPLIGNVQAEFDAATLLSGGDASEDKTAIKVFGEVANAGLFTFKKDSSVIDVLMRAGGVTRFAGVEQIRVINNNEPSIFNLKAYLDDGESAEVMILSEGATIFVPIAAKEVKVGSRMIYVMGEVQKPGAFENQEGATFLDILANSGGPTRFAETRQIRLLRANGEVIPFDLQSYTEKGSIEAPLPEIKAGDAIFVPEKPATDQKSWLKIPSSRAIYIMGAVRNPGRYEWSDEMDVFDLLAHAGGPEGRADISATQIIMRHPDGKVETQIFDLALFHEEGGHIKNVPVLKAGYTVMVPELPQDPTDNKAKWLRQSSERSIYILGQVNSAGRYAFDTSMSFLDILSAADGPSNNADIHNIRVMHRNGKGARISKLNLALYFETGDESILPNVVPGDTIYIPEKDRNWLDEEKESTIRVLGSVAKPGRYRFNDNMTILDLLAQAGGPNDDAYVEKIVVVNASCCEEKSSTFDLVGFVKNPDFAQLPVLREGDTVYVPNVSRSNWNIFMESVKDTLSIVTLYVLTAAML